MSDEPHKKPGARRESPTLDRLQAELSAGLKTGEDPLYYDWTRVVEAPPSEAAYVPPMQVQTHCMDTEDLAAVIGRDAAEAARHAPRSERNVVIDESAPRAEHGFEIDTFDDAMPTEEMPTGPVSDDRVAVTRRMGVLQRSRSGWIWLAVSVAALTIFALLMWTRREPASVVGASRAPTSNAATSPAPPLGPMAPTSTSAVLPSKTYPPIVRQPAAVPSRRSLPSGSTPRGRATSPSPTTPPKPTTNEAVDPLFTENPGY
jgi:hypothetical protein